ncbi:MAG: hypothetical protein CVU56_28955 [Deltaproteobacteria bacterium HGW-Deltaproteobacteria-14]|jgi:hypothetical protein|nr:MAG: hypothetical protein CVU56_28955 [Deltaproteobacteria bacterium HGW-Deltaproteobacteria-14]
MQAVHAPERAPAAPASLRAHVRVVDRLVVHPTPLSFRTLCRRAVPKDARYIVLDLDRTCFDGVNVGERLGFELIARQAYGDDFLDERDDERTAARFLWAWRRPVALVRYLATGMDQWAGPGLDYLLNLKLASRREASYRRSFRRFGPTAVEAIQRGPQLALFHQIAGVPLPRLRELATRVLRRHRARQVIDAADVAWLRGWCPDATVIIASASPQPVVEAAAAHLGADLALYSEIDVRDERPSAPARFPSAATRRSRPERFAPLETLRLNGGPRKITELRRRCPDIFDAGVVSVGISDTGYGEDHCWADHFTRVIDVNSPTPYSPIIDRASPLEAIHSARLLPSDAAEGDADALPGISLSGEALATTLAEQLDAIDALEEASRRWRQEPDDERAALRRARANDRARLDDAVAAYNATAPASLERERCLRAVHRSARALARREASLAAHARPEAMRAFAIQRAHEHARALLTPVSPRRPHQRRVRRSASGR